ncbi:hypothetical protein JCM24511_00271 [Saitozyma sp. JCM 24511]|nr:hypothetical protein JCM24511_00271 [Saitozyma sp. JCM 24511]
MSTSLELLLQMGRLALKDKTVLITGGSGDIGKATAILFKRADCNVIITGSNRDKLDKALNDMTHLGDGGSGKVWAFQCDIRDRKEVEEMVRKTVDECPPIDILINNAGYALNATVPFWEQDTVDLASVMDVNLTGLMNVTHAVMRHHMMVRKPQPTGTIVNLSSITGHQAPLKEFFETSYHTSKAGVEGFTSVLRHETVGTNIRVLINRPGTVRTEFHTRRNLYDLDKTDGFLGGMCPLAAEDIAVSVFWQCLQPERISVITMETLPTAQRSLYAADKGYEQRNGVGKCDEWQR